MSLALTGEHVISDQLQWWGKYTALIDQTAVTCPPEPTSSEERGKRVGERVWVWFPRRKSDAVSRKTNEFWMTKTTDVCHMPLPLK